MIKYRHGPNVARNATKAAWNTIVFGFATFAGQPELGVADAVFDSSGYKDKALDWLYGKAKNEQPMLSLIPPSSTGMPVMSL